MKVDLLIRENGWWPRAWGVIFLDNKVIVIKEDPYNAYSRGERRIERVGGIHLNLYENQSARIWTTKELQDFLSSLFEEDEVEVDEEVADRVLHYIPPGVKTIVSSYTIYL